MKKITNLKYDDGGTVIIFTLAPLGENEIVQKFTFEVEGNELLTKELLNSSKTKKIKEKDLFYCALGLFEKIKKINQEVPMIKGKVKISSSIQKGEFKLSKKIMLIHQIGTLTKNFPVFGLDSFGAKGDWEDIFYSNLQESYSVFLEQFGIKIPEKIMVLNNGELDEQCLNNFSSEFFIFE